MFRIRRIYDDTLPVNREAIQQVQQMLRSQFPLAPAEDSDAIPDKLRDPFTAGFRKILLVAENGTGQVLGFALVSQEQKLAFCFLDYLQDWELKALLRVSFHGWQIIQFMH